MTTGLKFYPENFTVEVVVPFVDLNGATFVPTAISAQLFNGEDELLEVFDPVVFNIADVSATITVLPMYNQIMGGTREARILRVTLTSALGDITKNLSYVIETDQRLVTMTNTFQSYEAAEILALDTVNAFGWKDADEEARKVALADAYRRLTNIPMTYGIKNIDGVVVQDYVIERDEWIEINSDVFAAFPTHFKRALRLAQVVEAAELLSGDEIAAKRRSGVITETIGESSLTLQSGGVDYGISAMTRTALAGYLHFNMRIARA